MPLVNLLGNAIASFWTWKDGLQSGRGASSRRTTDGIFWKIDLLTILRELWTYGYKEPEGNQRHLVERSKCWPVKRRRVDETAFESPPSVTWVYEFLREGNTRDGTSRCPGDGKEGFDATMSWTLNKVRRRIVSIDQSLGLLASSEFKMPDGHELNSLENAAKTLPPEVRSSLVSKLVDLGSYFYSRFEYKGELSDLTRSISLEEVALRLTPNGHPDLPMIMFNLAFSLHVRFKRTKDGLDLSEAISLEQKALLLTPEGHPALYLRLSGLGISFHDRHSHGGDLSDIAEAISLKRSALELMLPGHPELEARLSCLGDSLHARFKRLGELEDLKEATRLWYRAIELAPPGSSDQAKRQVDLCAGLFTLYERTGNIFDLEAAISMEALALGQANDGDLLSQFVKETTGKVTTSQQDSSSGRVDKLANAFRVRFERTGHLPDLKSAIILLRRALEDTSNGHPQLASRLLVLEGLMHTRYTLTEDVSDITGAILFQRKALELSLNQNRQKDHTESSQLLAPSHEPNDQRSRFTTPTSFDVPSTQHTEGPHPTFWLCSLACSLKTRFYHTDSLNDLNEAIHLEQRALELTPSDHPDLATFLTNLGNSLRTRYGRTGEFPDLVEAISLVRRALDLTPEGNPILPIRLANLGSSLATSFNRTDDLSELTEAISLGRRAVELIEEGNPALETTILTTLGHSLSTRFARIGELPDLSEAISLEERALQLTSEGDPALGLRLANLGSSFHARFNCVGELSDLLEAISLKWRAVQLAPQGHPESSYWLISLGTAFFDKFQSVEWTWDDADTAISCFKAAAKSAIGPQRGRLYASKRWARALQARYPDSPDILTVQGRYTRLQELSSVVLDAASAAFQAGRGDKALEWLEQGRCLVWQQLNNLRAPLDELAFTNRRLAEAIASCSEQLNQISSSRTHSHHGKTLQEKISMEDEARAHVHLAKRRDDLLARARAIPGFESFLLPSPYPEIVRGFPSTGYVVIINAHNDRFDALALSARARGPLHIPLPSFSMEKAKTHCHGLKLSFEQHRLRVRQRDATCQKDDDARGLRPAASYMSKGPIALMLQSLWVDLVKPILDALGIQKAKLGETPSRIWWCPTGVLSFLPIHAAGVYGAKCDPVSALDYVISSYTPTLSSLSDRVRTRPRASKVVQGLFLTSQPSPPSFQVPSIPGTTKEVRSIYRRAVEDGVRVHKLEGGDITVEGCLEYMGKFSSVHLACHASQKANDPLTSRFLFHDGSLELRTIIKQDLKHADLAFLSACQTSTGEESLSDEAVHLAAGMLAAGYRRVVATMWSIGDDEAPQVAKDFYDYIFERRKGSGRYEEGGGFDGSRSAEALHFAIQRLRRRLDNSDRSLLAWAPYVHWGY